MVTNKRLEENHEYIKQLAQSVAEGKYGIDGTAKMFKLVMKKGAWQAFKNEFGNEIHPIDFKTFVEKPYPEGLGTTLEMLEKLIKDDMEALSIFTHLVTGKWGGDHKSNNKSNNITLENNRGTTKGYALRKLLKDAPELHYKVIQGELSPHAAMMQAGFRDKKISIPINVEKTVEAIRRHFTDEEIEKIKELL